MSGKIQTLNNAENQLGPRPGVLAGPNSSQLIRGIAFRFGSSFRSLFFLHYLFIFVYSRNHSPLLQAPAASMSVVYTNRSLLLQGLPDRWTFLRPRRPTPVRESALYRGHRLFTAV